jgi:hypothetical protein
VRSHRLRQRPKAVHLARSRSAPYRCTRDLDLEPTIRAFLTAVLLTAALPLAAQQTIPTAPPDSAPSSQKPWYQQVSLRGYLQVRHNQLFRTSDDLSCTSCDRSISKNGGFYLRRARIGFISSPSARSNIFLQWDLASDQGTQQIVQMRDAWGEIYFGANKQFRLKAGQQILPNGFETPQSSQLRLNFDRSDALSSGAPGERDVGLLGSWSTPATRQRWQDLLKDDQRSTGDYGVVSAIVYNGQSLNKPDRNPSRHVMVRVAYPFAVGSQVVEVGASTYFGEWMMETVTTGVTYDTTGYDDQRVGGYIVLYPRPFGFTAEWVVGRGPEYQAGSNSITEEDLSGGYVMASYRLGHDGKWLTPYVRGQYYDGARKSDLDARHYETKEVEVGVRWHPQRPVEFLAAWAQMDRLFSDGANPDDRQEGGVLRLQLQLNY